MHSTCSILLIYGYLRTSRLCAQLNQIIVMIGQCQCWMYSFLIASDSGEQARAALHVSSNSVFDCLIHFHVDFCSNIHEYNYCNEWNSIYSLNLPAVIHLSMSCFLVCESCSINLLTCRQYHPYSVCILYTHVFCISFLLCAAWKRLTVSITLWNFHVCAPCG